MSMRALADITADLTAAYAARRAILQSQAQSINTGQSTTQVTRANLTEVNRLIDALKQELEDREQYDRGDGGIVSLNFRRRR